MKFKLLITLSFLFVMACARVNPQEKEQFETQVKMRHGIVPLEPAIERREENLIHKLDQASVARGKVMYNKHCLSCHGEAGQGHGPDAAKQAHPPADLQKIAREVSNFKFFMSISQWQGDMPGWKEAFNEADREDLVSYIKSLR